VLCSICIQPLRPTQPPTLGRMGYEYRSRGSGRAVAAGKLTVGLAYDWPCVTDCGISVYELSGIMKGDENPAYTPVMSMSPFTFLRYASVSVSEETKLFLPLQQERNVATEGY